MVRAWAGRLVWLAGAGLAGGCTLSVNAGYTGALPSTHGDGAGVRATGWLDLGNRYDLRPIFGSQFALDDGSFGWRLDDAALVGAAYGGDPFLAYSYLRLSPIAMGHAAKDQDPDPWFGVSGGAALGLAYMVDSHPEGTFIGLEGALYHDIAYRGPGAETYFAVGLTVGMHFDISFRVF